MKEKIKEILKENIEELADVEISDDLELITGGYIDSFDIINLISDFEEAFDIVIPLDNLEVAQFDTVNIMETVLSEFK